jgi:hypothetical protein
MDVSDTPDAKPEVVPKPDVEAELAAGVGADAERALLLPFRRWMRRATAAADTRDHGMWMLLELSYRREVDGLEPMDLANEMGDVAAPGLRRLRAMREKYPALWRKELAKRAWWRILLGCTALVLVAMWLAEALMP